MAREGLRARRRKLGLSQEELAERRGDGTRTVAVSTVARWERGETTPRSWHRRRLAEALDLSLDELDRLLDGGDAQTDSADDVAAVVSQLEDAVRAAASDGHRRSLLRLLGHAHEAAGEIAFDRLQLGPAADHYHQAHEVGVELGDSDLASVAVIQLGDIARRRRRQHAAVRLLQAAEQDVSGAGLLTQVKRSQTLARTYAELADRRAFERAIAHAEQLANWVSPEHHRDGEHSPQGVLLEKAQGLTVLGRPEEALAIYEQSSPTSFRTDRERGSFLIVHAQALAGAGHLDEGVRLAVEGLQLARRYGSPRHVSRVQRMHDRLVLVWPRTEPHLVELRDALAAS
ncbi:MAG TPA: helix-turn-helix transcriptional regulator [Acidimicrobiales bacterium]